MTPDQFMRTAKERKSNRINNQLIRFQQQVIVKNFHNAIHPNEVRSIMKDEGVTNKIDEIRHRAEGILGSTDIQKVRIKPADILNKGVKHSFIQDFLKTEFDACVFKMLGNKLWVIHTHQSNSLGFAPMIMFNDDGVAITLEPLTSFIINNYGEQDV